MTSHDSAPAAAFVTSLMASQVLDEMHALLWIAASNAQGMRDEGWSCREHAVVIGALASLNGLVPSVCHGFNIFILGATPTGRLLGVGQQRWIERYGHSWLDVDGFGVVDLSVRFDSFASQGQPIVSDGVLGDGWPTNRGVFPLVVTNSERTYTTELAEATYRDNDGRAIYGVASRERFDPSMLGPGHVDSPLTRRIRTLDDAIYEKLVVHLIGVGDGTRSSLAGKDVKKAWRIVARIPDVAVDALRRRLRQTQV